MMNNIKIPNYIHPLILAASLLFSVILKISFIDAKELWLDETYSHFLISCPLPKMVQFIVGDVHPPIYYLLLKLWSKIFGLTPYSLRAFSLLISCLIPVVAFFAAKTIFNHQWTALLCFLLVLFSSKLFLYSVEVRPYMPALLFLSISFYCYVQILSKDTTLKIHILFSVAAACAFYSHYFSLFILLPIFVHYFVFVFKGGLPVKKFVFSVVLVSVLTGPWLPIILHQWEQRTLSTTSLASASQNSDTLNYGYTSTVNSKVYLFTKTYHYIKNSAFGGYAPKPDNHILKWMIRAAKTLFVFFFLLALFKGDKIAVLLVMVLAGYLMCVFLAMKTLFVPRYFLFLSLFMPFFICISMHYMKSMVFVRYFSILAAILIIISISVENVNISKANHCKPYTRAVAFLKHHYKTRDLIIFNNLLSEVPFDTYSNLCSFNAKKKGFPMSIYDWWTSQSYKGWSGPVITKRNMEEFIERLRSDKKIKRIWLVTEEGVPYDPGLQLLQRMSEIYSEFEKRYTDPCAGSHLSFGLEIYLFKQPMQ
jgi:4-amino-4-deoxy-L-arabinose transferase-like glycosyltransferase